MKKIIQVFGPTGVGKSKVGIFIAKKFNGEIISADSMQVYKKFNIGTDKINFEDMNGIPHHLLDFIEDCSQFNANRFLQKSFKVSEQILERNKIPVVCGGTALYFRIMKDGIHLESKIKKISRKEIENNVSEKGIMHYWTKLKKIDPNYAKKIGPNDRLRIIRAFDIYLNNGYIPSELHKLNFTPFKNYRFIRIGLNIERKDLYQRIEKRIDLMIKRGLVNEVKMLLNDYPKECPPFKAIGYKEIVLHIKGVINFDEAVTLLKKNSRNYAKRQLTWLRKEKDVKWFSPDDNEGIMRYLNNEIG